MTEEVKFSRIAVTADDEDDFVIEAGIPNTQTSPKQDVSSKSESVLEASTSVSSVPTNSNSFSDLQAEKQTAFTAEENATNSKRPSAHHETTLADLEATKMSAVQKSIIIVALLAILAFAAYYVFLR